MTPHEGDGMRECKRRRNALRARRAFARELRAAQRALDRHPRWVPRMNDGSPDWSGVVLLAATVAVAAFAAGFVLGGSF